MTPAQRAVAAAHVFLASAALAGLTLQPRAVEWRTAGMVASVLALLLAYLLVRRRAWPSPAGVPGWAAVAYGTAATAQLLHLLLPPPGLFQTMLVAALGLAAWGALGRGTRHRLVVSLAALAAFLAAVRFSLLPAMWTAVDPTGAPLGMEGLAERARGAVAEPLLLAPGGELPGVAALALWALATWLVWPEAVVGERKRPGTALARVPVEEAQEG